MQIGTCDHCGEQSVDGMCTDVMSKVFDRVADANDWRAPIDYIIEAELRSEVEAAVIHYTATVPTFTDVQPHNGVRMVRVQAVGYRAGPAGP